MKKAVTAAIGAAALGIALYFVGTGFFYCGSAYIENYTVSEDGTEITLTMGVGSSAGYLRKAVVHPQKDGGIALDFRSAFGGINGSIGAENVYTIPLEPETKTIALDRGGSYEVVLEKEPSGRWNRAKAEPALPAGETAEEGTTD